MAGLPDLAAREFTNRDSDLELDCLYHILNSSNIMSGYNHTPADDLAIATIRTLAVDTVGKANSGHPGANTCFLVRDCLLAYIFSLRCANGHGTSSSYPFFSVCPFSCYKKLS